MASVLEYLQGRGQIFTVIPRPRASAPGSEARAARAMGDLVIKTVVVIGKGGLAILVIPAAKVPDLSLVAEALGDEHVRLATEWELERHFPDYEPGALPPLSLLLLAPMYVDPVVLERREIVFAAGRRDVSVKMSTHDLFGGDPVVIAPLTSESHAVAAP